MGVSKSCEMYFKSLAVEMVSRVRNFFGGRQAAPCLYFGGVGLGGN